MFRRLHYSAKKWYNILIIIILHTYKCKGHTAQKKHKHSSLSHSFSLSSSLISYDPTRRANLYLSKQWILALDSANYSNVVIISQQNFNFSTFYLLYFFFTIKRLLRLIEVFAVSIMCLKCNQTRGNLIPLPSYFTSRVKEPNFSPGRVYFKTFSLRSRLQVTLFQSRVTIVTAA